MSRTTTRRPRLRARGDDGGFTLIEVMAAMVVFALASTAVTAMFASGLRASLLTKMDTTAKNLGQQRLEQIRNLPFHIDQVSTGSNPPDLLDTYFKNTTGTVGRGVQGFVPAGAQRWTADGDPATGAFYRYVQTSIPGYPKFKQYVATQFVDDAGSPFAPGTFNSQTVGFDAPPTLQVGIGVTTLWKAGKLDRVARLYTQVTSGRPAAPSSVLQARVTALRLSGGIADGYTVSEEFGVFAADGAIAQTVSAAETVKGAVLSLSGTAVNGAVSSVQAPPNATSSGASSGPKTLTVFGTNWGTVASTSTQNLSASSGTGQVLLSSATSPARGSLLGAGAGERIATLVMDEDAPDRLALSSVQAFVQDAQCGGGCINVGATGYAATTSASSARTTATSATGLVRGVVALLPTTFAPNGLIRLKLDSLSLACSVTRGTSPAASVTMAYSGSVSYYAPFAVGNVAGYKTVAVSSTDSTSPLTSTLLSQTQVGTDTNGSPLWLSDYFQSWGSMTAGALTAAKSVSSDLTSASASFSSVLSVTSVPLRPGDDKTYLAAELGAASCSAEDKR